MSTWITLAGTFQAIFLSNLILEFSSINSRFVQRKVLTTFAMSILLLQNGTVSKIAAAVLDQMTVDGNGF